MRSAPELLGVQAGEGRATGFMVAHSFFMGLCTVFFETAASALFLSQFGPATLPWVYITAAVLNTATGVLYSRLQRAVSFAHLMTGTLVFLFVTISGFRVAEGLTQAAWLSFGLLVFYRAVSILTDLEYWAVAARLYNVRQAKRLYGLIGSGEVTARIVGSFAVPGLVAAFGVRNLITLSGMAVFGCVVVLLPILRLIPAEARQSRDAGSRQAPRPAADWGSIARDRYLVGLLGLAAMAVLGKYFVDFAFLEAMRSREQDVKGLATFFGLFSGITQTLSLLTRLLLSGRILGRYGIRVGLLVMPVGHLLCTVAIVVAALAGGMGGPAGAVVFWMVISNQGVYKVLKHPIDNPSFKVLYQPLRKEQRLAAQIAVETLVSPVMIGIAGAVMLFFATVVPPEHRVEGFAWAMLATFLTWVVLGRRTAREYSAALVRALQGRFVDHATFSLSDEPSLALVKDKLGSPDPGDVVFALDLLERFDYPGLPALLQQRLEHPAPEVRRYVLQRVEALRLTDLLPAVGARAHEEPDPQVRGAAVRCLCALERRAAGSAATALLEEGAPPVRRGAIVGLLRYREGVGADLARRHLDQLAAAPDPADRVLAAQIVGEVDRPGFDATLLALVRDPHPDVQRAAMTAVARVTASDVWREVIDDLASPTLGATAVNALISLGEKVVPDLVSRFRPESGRLLQYRVAFVLGRIGGAAATAALRGQLRHADGVVRLRVCESLSRAGYAATLPGERAEVEAAVDEEAREAAWATAAYLDLEGDQALASLQEALISEVDAARRRVMALLSFLYDPKAVLTARDNLAHESKEKRAYAMEVLDLTLPQDLKAVVLPLLDDLAPGQRLDQLSGRFPQQPLSRDQRLRDIASRPPHAIKFWTRACVLFGAAQLGIEGVAELVPPVHDPIVKQTLAWAASRTRPRRANGEDAMLDIEKVMILRGAQMFANTPEEVLADVASIVEEVDLKKGEVIFRKGDPGDSMYIIIEGHVRVFDGDRTINQLGRRDIFGELALLDPEPRSASVAATVDTRLLRIDRETFTELMAGNISIVRGILHVLCDRLRQVGITPRDPGPGTPAAG